MDLNLVVVILAAGTMLILALIFGYILGWANVAFAVKVDPRIDAINVALPGANCGGCGYVGCNDYSEAVVNNGEDITKCAPGGSSCAEAIGKIMGMEVGETLPFRPVVHCGAVYAQRLQRMEYRGEMTCIAANMVAGIQGCTYGCLGFGDCKTSCKYNALEIVDGLSTIDYENCVGCGACAVICPRNIITMTPFKSKNILAVKCSNKDFGKDVTGVCTVGCIGCKACTKNSELFHMVGNIAEIDYERYNPEKDRFQSVLDKCPRAMLVEVGMPTDKHLEIEHDDHSEEPIEADFKTTVDDAEWRG